MANNADLSADVLTVTMTNANQEYTITIPGAARTVTVQCRTADDVRVAGITGKVGTPTDPYFTLKAGGRLDLVKPSPFAGADFTLYFACAAAGKVVECILGKVT